MSTLASLFGTTEPQLALGVILMILGVLFSGPYTDLYQWAKGKAFGKRSAAQIGGKAVGVNTLAAFSGGMLTGMAAVGLFVFAVCGAIVAGLLVYRWKRESSRQNLAELPVNPILRELVPSIAAVTIASEPPTGRDRQPGGVGDERQPVNSK